MLAFEAPRAPRVSIVIVTTRRLDRLLRCLAAVRRELPAGVPCEVILVLNAAEDELAEGVRRQVSGGRIISSSVPLGFAGGANLGAAQARGELVHLLHDDTEVCPGWLTALVAVLDARPEVGLAGSLVLDLAGEVQSAGHVVWSDGSTSPRWAGSPPRAESFWAVEPVDYCASASVLVRRAAWERIGGLDEELHPAYYVDVDLAMALRHHGYSVVCAPASRVRHARGGSGGQAFRSFVSARNRERFVAKWAGPLANQAPAGADAGALRRARDATRRVADGVADRPPASASPTGNVAGFEDRRARAGREQGQLLRDIAVKDAFIAHAETLFAEAETTRRRLEADGAIAQQALAELDAARADVERRYAALVEEHDRLRAERDRLLRRLAAAEDARGLRGALRGLARRGRRAARRSRGGRQ